MAIHTRRHTYDPAEALTLWVYAWPRCHTCFLSPAPHAFGPPWTQASRRNDQYNSGY